MSDEIIAAAVLFSPIQRNPFFINSGGDYTPRAKFLLHVTPLRQRLYPGDGSALPVQTARSLFFVLLETKGKLFSRMENIKETCCLPAQNKTLEMQSETMRNELFLLQRQRSGRIFKIHSKYSLFSGEGGGGAARTPGVCMTAIGKCPLASWESFVQGKGCIKQEKR